MGNLITLILIIILIIDYGNSRPALNEGAGPDSVENVKYVEKYFKDFYDKYYGKSLGKQVIIGNGDDFMDDDRDSKNPEWVVSEEEDSFTSRTTHYFPKKFRRTPTTPLYENFYQATTPSPLRDYTNYYATPSYSNLNQGYTHPKHYNAYTKDWYKSETDPKPSSFDYAQNHFGYENATIANPFDQNHYNAMVTPSDHSYTSSFQKPPTQNPVHTEIMKIMNHYLRVTPKPESKYEGFPGRGQQNHFSASPTHGFENDQAHPMHSRVSKNPFSYATHGFSQGPARHQPGLNFEQIRKTLPINSPFRNSPFFPQMQRHHTTGAPFVVPHHQTTNYYATTGSPKMTGGYPNRNIYSQLDFPNRVTASQNGYLANHRFSARQNNHPASGQPINNILQTGNTAPQNLPTPGKVNALQKENTLPVPVPRQQENGTGQNKAESFYDAIQNKRKEDTVGYNSGGSFTSPKLPCKNAISSQQNQQRISAARINTQQQPRNIAISDRPPSYPQPTQPAVANPQNSHPQPAVAETQNKNLRHEGIININNQPIYNRGTESPIYRPTQRNFVLRPTLYTPRPQLYQQTQRINDAPIYRPTQRNFVLRPTLYTPRPQIYQHTQRTMVSQYQQFNIPGKKLYSDQKFTQAPNFGHTSNIFEATKSELDQIDQFNDKFHEDELGLSFRFPVRFGEHDESELDFDDEDTTENAATATMAYSSQNENNRRIEEKYFGVTPRTEKATTPSSQIENSKYQRPVGHMLHFQPTIPPSALEADPMVPHKNYAGQESANNRVQAQKNYGQEIARNRENNLYIAPKPTTAPNFEQNNPKPVTSPNFGGAAPQSYFGRTPNPFTFPYSQPTGRPHGNVGQRMPINMNQLNAARNVPNIVVLPRPTESSFHKSQNQFSQGRIYPFTVPQNVYNGQRPPPLQYTTIRPWHPMQLYTMTTPRPISYVPRTGYTNAPKKIPNPKPSAQNRIVNAEASDKLLKSEGLKSNSDDLPKFKNSDIQQSLPNPEGKQNTDGRATSESTLEQTANKNAELNENYRQEIVRNQQSNFQITTAPNVKQTKQQPVTSPNFGKTALQNIFGTTPNPYTSQPYGRPYGNNVGQRPINMNQFNAPRKVPNVMVLPRPTESLQNRFNQGHAYPSTVPQNFYNGRRPPTPLQYTTIRPWHPMQLYPMTTPQPVSYVTRTGNTIIPRKIPKTIPSAPNYNAQSKLNSDAEEALPKSNDLPKLKNSGVQQSLPSYEGKQNIDGPATSKSTLQQIADKNAEFDENYRQEIVTNRQSNFGITQTSTAPNVRQTNLKPVTSRNFGRTAPQNNFGTTPNPFTSSYSQPYGRPYGNNVGRIIPINQFNTLRNVPNVVVLPRPTESPQNRFNQGHAYPSTVPQNFYNGRRPASPIQYTTIRPWHPMQLYPMTTPRPMTYVTRTGNTITPKKVQNAKPSAPNYNTKSKSNSEAAEALEKSDDLPKLKNSDVQQSLPSSEGKHNIDDPATSESTLEQMAVKNAKLGENYGQEIVTNRQSNFKITPKSSTAPKVKHTNLNPVTSRNFGRAAPQNNFGTTPNPFTSPYSQPYGRLYGNNVGQRIPINQFNAPRNVPNVLVLPRPTESLQNRLNQGHVYPSTVPQNFYNGRRPPPPQYTTIRPWHRMQLYPMTTPQTVWYVTRTGNANASKKVPEAKPSAKNKIVKDEAGDKFLNSQVPNSKNQSPPEEQIVDENDELNLNQPAINQPRIEDDEESSEVSVQQPASVTENYEKYLERTTKRDMSNQILGGASKTTPIPIDITTPNSYGANWNKLYGTLDYPHLTVSPFGSNRPLVRLKDKSVKNNNKPIASQKPPGNQSNAKPENSNKPIGSIPSSKITISGGSGKNQYDEEISAVLKNSNQIKTGTFGKNPAISKPEIQDVDADKNIFDFLNYKKRQQNQKKSETKENAQDLINKENQQTQKSQLQNQGDDDQKQTTTGTNKQTQFQIQPVNWARQQIPVNDQMQSQAQNRAGSLQNQGPRDINQQRFLALNLQNQKIAARNRQVSQMQYQLQNQALNQKISDARLNLQNRWYQQTTQRNVNQFQGFTRMDPNGFTVQIPNQQINPIFFNSQQNYRVNLRNQNLLNPQNGNNRKVPEAVNFSGDNDHKSGQNQGTTNPTTAAVQNSSDTFVYQNSDRDNPMNVAIRYTGMRRNQSNSNADFNNFRFPGFLKQLSQAGANFKRKIGGFGPINIVANNGIQYNKTKAFEDNNTKPPLQINKNGLERRDGNKKDEGKSASQRNQNRGELSQDNRARGIDGRQGVRDAQTLQQNQTTAVPQGPRTGAVSAEPSLRKQVEYKSIPGLQATGSEYNRYNSALNPRMSSESFRDNTAEGKYWQTANKGEIVQSVQTQSSGINIPLNILSPQKVSNQKQTEYPVDVTNPPKPSILTTEESPVDVTNPSKSQNYGNYVSKSPLDRNLPSPGKDVNQQIIFSSNRAPPQTEPPIDVTNPPKANIKNKEEPPIDVTNPPKSNSANLPSRLFDQSNQIDRNIPSENFTKKPQPKDVNQQIVSPRTQRPQQELPIDVTNAPKSNLPVKEERPIDTTNPLKPQYLDSYSPDENKLLPRNPIDRNLQSQQPISSGINLPLNLLSLGTQGPTSHQKEPPIDVTDRPNTKLPAREEPPIDVTNAPKPQNLEKNLQGNDPPQKYFKQQTVPIGLNIPLNILSPGTQRPEPPIDVTKPPKTNIPVQELPIDVTNPPKSQHSESYPDQNKLLHSKKSTDQIIPAENRSQKPLLSSGLNLPLNILSPGTQRSFINEPPVDVTNPPKSIIPSNEEPPIDVTNAPKPQNYDKLLYGNIPSQTITNPNRGSGFNYNQGASSGINIPLNLLSTGISKPEPFNPFKVAPPTSNFATNVPSNVANTASPKPNIPQRPHISQGKPLIPNTNSGINLPINILSHGTSQPNIPTEFKPKDSLPSTPKSVSPIDITLPPTPKEKHTPIDITYPPTPKVVTKSPPQPDIDRGINLLNEGQPTLPETTTKSEIIDITESVRWLTRPQTTPCSEDGRDPSSTYSWQFHDNEPIDVTRSPKIPKNKSEHQRRTKPKGSSRITKKPKPKTWSLPSTATLPNYYDKQITERPNSNAFVQRSRTERSKSSWKFPNIFEITKSPKLEIPYDPIDVTQSHSSAPVTEETTTKKRWKFPRNWRGTLAPPADLTTSPEIERITPSVDQFSEIKPRMDNSNTPIKQTGVDVKAVTAESWTLPSFLKSIIGSHKSEGRPNTVTWKPQWFPPTYKPKTEKPNAVTSQSQWFSPTYEPKPGTPRAVTSKPQWFPSTYKPKTERPNAVTWKSQWFAPTKKPKTENTDAVTSKPQWFSPSYKPKTERPDAATWRPQTFAPTDKPTTGRSNALTWKIPDNPQPFTTSYKLVTDKRNPVTWKLPDHMISFIATIKPATVGPSVTWRPPKSPEGQKVPTPAIKQVTWTVPTYVGVPDRPQKASTEDPKKIIWNLPNSLKSPGSSKRPTKPTLRPEMVTWKLPPELTNVKKKPKNIGINPTTVNPARVTWNILQMQKPEVVAWKPPAKLTVGAKPAKNTIPGGNVLQQINPAALNQNNFNYAQRYPGGKPQNFVNNQNNLNTMQQQQRPRNPTSNNAQNILNSINPPQQQGNRNPGRNVPNIPNNPNSFNFVTNRPQSNNVPNFISSQKGLNFMQQQGQRNSGSNLAGQPAQYNIVPSLLQRQDQIKQGNNVATNPNILNNQHNLLSWQQQGQRYPGRNIPVQSPQSYIDPNLGNHNLLQQQAQRIPGGNAANNPANFANALNNQNGFTARPQQAQGNHFLNNQNNLNYLQQQAQGIQGRHVAGNLGQFKNFQNNLGPSQQITQRNFAINPMFNNNVQNVLNNQNLLQQQTQRNPGINIQNTWKPPINLQRQKPRNPDFTTPSNYVQPITWKLPANLQQQAQRNPGGNIQYNPAQGNNVPNILNNQNSFNAQGKPRSNPSKNGNASNRPQSNPEATTPSNYIKPITWRVSTNPQYQTQRYPDVTTPSNYVQPITWRLPANLQQQAQRNPGGNIKSKPVQGNNISNDLTNQNSFNAQGKPSKKASNRPQGITEAATPSNYITPITWRLPNYPQQQTQRNTDVTTPSNYMQPITWKLPTNLQQQPQRNPGGNIKSKPVQGNNLPNVLNNQNSVNAQNNNVPRRPQDYLDFTTPITWKLPSNLRHQTQRIPDFTTPSNYMKPITWRLPTNLGVTGAPRINQHYQPTPKPINQHYQPTPKPIKGLPSWNPLVAANTIPLNQIRGVTKMPVILQNAPIHPNRAMNLPHATQTQNPRPIPWNQDPRNPLGAANTIQLNPIRGVTQMPVVQQNAPMHPKATQTQNPRPIPWNQDPRNPYGIAYPQKVAYPYGLQNSQNRGMVDWNFPPQTISPLRSPIRNQVYNQNQAKPAATTDSAVSYTERLEVTQIPNPLEEESPDYLQLDEIAPRLSNQEPQLDIASLFDPITEQQPDFSSSRTVKKQLSHQKVANTDQPLLENLETWRSRMVGPEYITTQPVSRPKNQIFSQNQQENIALLSPVSRNPQQLGFTQWPKYSHNVVNARAPTRNQFYNQNQQPTINPPILNPATWTPRLLGRTIPYIYSEHVVPAGNQLRNRNQQQAQNNYAQHKQTLRYPSYEMTTSGSQTNKIPGNTNIPTSSNQFSQPPLFELQPSNHRQEHAPNVTPPWAYQYPIPNQVTRTIETQINKADKNESHSGDDPVKSFMNFINNLKKLKTEPSTATWDPRTTPDIFADRSLGTTQLDSKQSLQDLMLMFKEIAGLNKPPATTPAQVEDLRYTDELVFQPSNSGFTYFVATRKPEAEYTKQMKDVDADVANYFKSLLKELVNQTSDRSSSGSKPLQERIDNEMKKVPHVLSTRSIHAENIHSQKKITGLPPCTSTVKASVAPQQNFLKPAIVPKSAIAWSSPRPLMFWSSPRPVMAWSSPRNIPGVPFMGIRHPPHPQQLHRVTISKPIRFNNADGHINNLDTMKLLSPFFYLVSISKQHGANHHIPTPPIIITGVTKSPAIADKNLISNAKKATNQFAKPNVIATENSATVKDEQNVITSTTKTVTKSAVEDIIAVTLKLDTTTEGKIVSATTALEVEKKKPKSATELDSDEFSGEAFKVLLDWYKKYYRHHKKRMHDFSSEEEDADSFEKYRRRLRARKWRSRFQNIRNFDSGENDEDELKSLDSLEKRQRIKMIRRKYKSPEFISDEDYTEEERDRRLKSRKYLRKDVEEGTTEIEDTSKSKPKNIDADLKTKEVIHEEKAKQFIIETTEKSRDEDKLIRKTTHDPIILTTPYIAAVEEEVKTVTYPTITVQTTSRVMIKPTEAPIQVINEKEESSYYSEDTPKYQGEVPQSAGKIHPPRDTIAQVSLADTNKNFPREVITPGSNIFNNNIRFIDAQMTQANTFRPPLAQVTAIPLLVPNSNMWKVVSYATPRNDGRFVIDPSKRYIDILKDAETRSVSKSNFVSDSLYATKAYNMFPKMSPKSVLKNSENLYVKSNVGVTNAYGGVGGDGKIKHAGVESGGGGNNGARPGEGTRYGGTGSGIEGKTGGSYGTGGNARGLYGVSGHRGGEVNTVGSHGVHGGGSHSGHIQESGSGNTGSRGSNVHSGQHQESGRHSGAGGGGGGGGLPNNEDEAKEPRRHRSHQKSDTNENDAARKRQRKHRRHTTPAPYVREEDDDGIPGIGGRVRSHRRKDSDLNVEAADKQAEDLHPEMKKYREERHRPSYQEIINAGGGGGSGGYANHNHHNSENSHNRKSSRSKSDDSTHHSERKSKGKRRKDGSRSRSRN